MAERTESSLSINSDPGSVLDVIADLESYPEWAASIKNVTVLTEDELGWADQAELTLDSPLFKDTYVLDYTWDVEEDGSGVISWSLVRGRVFTVMDGSYTLVEADGGTSVTYRLTFDVAIPMPSALKRKAEETIVETALRELKTRVEG